MREWARVLGLEPNQRVVAAYIRKLRPVTLTRDTRVTNHSFVDGRAVAFQSILQAGTAVLVDKDGVPVARCRCGNPLLEPVYIPEATCYGCPPNYRPPPPCDYYDYDDTDYRRYGDGYWKRIYVRRDFVDVCYYPYPDPPTVNRRPLRRVSPHAHAAGDQPGGVVLAVQRHGGRHLHALGLGLQPQHDPQHQPHAAGRGRPRTTASPPTARGSGSYTFPQAGDAVLGTYTATVTDPRTGRSASASTTVSAAPEAAPPPQQDQGLNCEAPQSQLEFEQCRDAGQLPEQQEPAPDPNYECDVDPATPGLQPPAHPGEDWLRNCGLACRPARRRETGNFADAGGLACYKPT